MAICNNKKCSLGECDQAKTCSAYVPVMTHADRIRAMNDKEMSYLVVKHDLFHCTNCSEYKQEECDEKCVKHCLEWLQQPWEEK